GCALRSACAVRPTTSRDPSRPATRTPWRLAAARLRSLGAGSPRPLPCRTDRRAVEVPPVPAAAENQTVRRRLSRLYRWRDRPTAALRHGGRLPTNLPPSANEPAAGNSDARCGARCRWLPRAWRSPPARLPKATTPTQATSAHALAIAGAHGPRSARAV